MTTIRIIILTIFVATSIRSQNLIGGGIGFDWIESFDATPMYANKDINLFFSHSKKHFIIEARQGLRYFEGFDAVRNNTYLLIGFTSLRENFFVFDISVGGALSWTNQGKSGDYPTQFCPTIKTSFNFRINNKKTLYLGADWLYSSYHYPSGTSPGGSPREAFGLTGSVLISLHYILPKKQKTEKTIK
jgi:hypothetical protein